jgi:hypothetical protein
VALRAEDVDVCECGVVGVGYCCCCCGCRCGWVSSRIAGRRLGRGCAGRDDMGTEDVGETGNGEAAVCVEDDGGSGFVGGRADYAAGEEVVEELRFAGAGFKGCEFDGGWVSRTGRLSGTCWTCGGDILRCCWGGEEEVGDVV